MEGIWTVIPTIFSTSNSIDLKAISRLIELQIEKKVDGIVLLGTTSEVSTLTDLEKNLIVNLVHHNYRSKIISNKLN